MVSVVEEGEISYSPAKLLNTVMTELGLRNDAALARLLDIQAPLLSKIRNGKLPISAGVLLRLHEVSGRSIDDLRFLMGDRRTRFRICARSNPSYRRRKTGQPQGKFPSVPAVVRRNNGATW